MRLIILAGLLALPMTAHAQKVVVQFDLTKFALGVVVGTPAAVDTDGDPETREYLVRYKAALADVRASYASVVVRVGEHPCIGQAFLWTGDVAGGELQHDGRTLHVRTATTLTVYRLDTPRCH